MPIEGTINSLYLDYEQTKPLFPRTKTKAVSDENGVGLDATLSKIQNDLSNKATESFVTNEIAKAQLGGGGDIDLSGFATKDDISILASKEELTLLSNAIPTTPEAIGAEVSGAANNALNNAKTYVNEQINAIDYPVDSVNGKTGAVQLSATEVGALSTNGGTVNGHIYMGDQFTVYGLIDPLSPHDAMTKRYADANYAPASHKHDNYYFKRYSLNAINIDDTDGSWEVDIAGQDNGTVPVDWVNVTQNTSGHFYTQIAKQCQSTTDATRKNSGLWYREKYITGAWSAWSKIYHEGAKPTASEIGAAPAGYGVGGYSLPKRTIHEIDSILENGKYLLDNFLTGIKINNVTFNYAFLRVHNDGYNKRQELFPINTNHDRIVRSMISQGVWSDWESDHPPMELGKEYRTAERWNGKTVFVKLVSLGSMPNGVQKTVDVANNGDFVVSADFTHRTADGWTVSKHPSIDISVKRQNNGWLYVDVTATGDMSGYVENYALVKYTKTTD